MKEKDSLKILMQKSIYEILDGDKLLDKYDSYELKMPYLSGTNIWRYCTEIWFFIAV